MDERWKPVAGWEQKYEISTHGRVRSKRRVVLCRSAQYEIDGGILSAHVKSNGYLSVGFREGKKKRVHFSIHRLVAAAFIANPAEKPCVNHIDNDPTNNHVDNLEWCTQAENLAHMTAQGRRSGFPSGQRSPMSSLDDETVRAIRAAYVIGDSSHQGLADKYGTNKRTVGRILTGKIYQYVL